MKKKLLKTIEIRAKLALEFFEKQKTSKYLDNIDSPGVNALFQFGESVLPGYYLNIKNASPCIDYTLFNIYKSELHEILSDESFLIENKSKWPELIVFAILSKELLENIGLVYFGTE